jgi:hypothetical protein
VRIMKWTVTLLLGCLVLGSAVPTSAEDVVVVDRTVLEAIESHLVRALDGLNRLNLQRAWNHITRAMNAMNLIPDSQPVPLGLFKIKAPFTWSESNGPMPIRVGAMIDDGTPQPLFRGTVVLGMMGFGRLVTLYDVNMVQLPGTQTTTFSDGGWEGYVVLDTGTGATLDVALQGHDPLSGVGGGSQVIIWMVP